MRVAVLSLTRDRLDYTKHCFGTLREFAGCDYDHYVLDNASEDGTVDWLEQQFDIHHVVSLDENIGIARGLNQLTDVLTDDYDVIVHFDNDCELTMPNTIRDVARLVHETGAILSPRILGLQNPPATLRKVQHNGEIIRETAQIGGICLTAPAWLFDEYRYPNTLPSWGMEDAHVCSWFRGQLGGTVGYVDRLEAWHYETTAGQRERFPAYFERKDLEYTGVAA